MANEQQPDDQVEVLDGEEGNSGQPGTARSRNEDAGSSAIDASSQSHDELLLTLQDAQTKADDYWNQLLLAKADMTNMQRRSERELENAHKYGLEKFVQELLPIKDSLELGLTATEGQELDLDKLREGMEMTLKLLGDAVAKFGVAEINPVGELFNPEFHQAMTTQPAEEGVAANTVLTVFQKGYLLNDRLIRPAMVVVAK